MNELDELIYKRTYNERDEQDLHLERFAKFLVSMYEKYGDCLKIEYDDEENELGKSCLIRFFYILKQKPAWYNCVDNTQQT